MRALCVAFLLLMITGSAVSATPPEVIARAVADSSRPANDRALDRTRKPAEVLAYAGVHRGEEIAEYLPGGGYYTRLLSDIVGPSGKIYALETTTWGQENIEATRAVLSEPGHGNVVLDLAPLGTFRLPAQVDLFWTSLNYHDLHVPKYAKVDMAAFNRHVFQSLKPGGIYLIIDHASAPGTGASVAPTLHRIEKSTVISEVTAAGFRLAGESAILQNPADDHSKIVSDPSVRWKTDQFILRFVKPR